MNKTIQPGDWLQGPFWQGTVRVVHIQHRSGHDLVTVHSADQNLSQTYILTPADWEQTRRVAQADRRGVSFDGDPARFRLGIEAHRLRLAHSSDPYAALNASRIDPLPHQFEAVYDHLLARPVVRALLAHDAGAGKTIMAGMVIKELQRRQGARRVLIVAPAGLTVQWRREMLTKFGLDFSIVSRGYMAERHLDSLDVWRETDLAITSIAFARQKEMRRALESVEWDVVVVDEAHKMAAYVRPNGSIRRTDAYKLGQVLSRRAPHFLLMTATPHKGDPDNYRLLVSLIDPQWGDATPHARGANPAVLRRTKEEMRKPDGAPLYPERIVDTLPYTISPQEGDLLEQVHKFVRKRYAKAKGANQQSAAFALLTLERRMASSPYALHESLARMQQRLTSRLEGRPTPPARVDDEEGWAAWEDLAEEERWEREAQAEAAAADLVSRRQLGAELRELEALMDKAAALQRQESHKIAALRQACDLWVGERGEQLIVFTEFRDTLDDLVRRLAEWGYTTTEIHGGMKVKERRAAEKVFWDGQAQVLVATEAAGEGINLQCCSVMVNFDIPWNPCRLEQRMGRIHRYGQKAPQVHVFNLVATNTMEGQVKEALLKKLKAMQKDLGDKVFDVVGEVLWGEELRRVLERIALGEPEAVAAAKGLIDWAGDAADRAIHSERRVAAADAPLDVAGFRRKQATFPAHRLSPETAEAFFRRAVVFLGGGLDEFAVQAEDGHSYPAFEVTLPPELAAGQRRPRLSFWPAACSDDETKKDAVLFIAPGHRLFETLIERVVAACADDLDRGAVFLDLQPRDAAAYLVWFVGGYVRDGLGRRAGDVLAALRHRADEEEVVPLALEALDGFDLAAGEAVDAAVQVVQPMLGAQEEVLAQCVGSQFLPQLEELCQAKGAALVRDRSFLVEGLTALADHLSSAAMDAYAEGDSEQGDALTDQGEAARRRLAELEAEMARAGQVLLVAPDVLGTALVLPAPLELVIESEAGPTRVTMRRDDEVEAAAMRIVMEYEKGQGRCPKDVHQGKSWDVESYDAQGTLLRYIEVKGRGPADADVVVMTDPEWQAARRLGERHWLYVVRLGDGLMWLVQNPFARLAPKELKRWVIKLEKVAESGTPVSLRS